MVAMLYGPPVSVSGGLDSLTHEQVLEVWYAWPLCSGLLQGEWYGHAAKCAP